MDNPARSPSINKTTMIAFVAAFSVAKGDRNVQANLSIGGREADANMKCKRDVVASNFHRSHRLQQCKIVVL
jgi:hypothetical protein